MKKNVAEGVPVSETIPEELKAERQRIAEEKKRIIAQLNEIKYPLSATVYTHGQPWSIRNITFWKNFQKRDEDIIKFLDEYLTKNGS